jgi:penicillin-binding protein 1B
MPGILLGLRRWSFLARLILAGTFSLFFLLAAGVLAAYHIRVDRMIEGRVSRQPLDSISSIFSAPKRIFVDQNLSPQELIEYLRRAGYADSPQQGATGQYLVADTLVEIRPSIRSYFEGKNAVTVEFFHSKISGIRSIGTSEELDSAELEPLLLTNIFNDNTREKRRFVPFHDLPPFLVDAVLSVEDVRFFEHHGVDPFRVLGAAWINVRRRTKAQGASTITMQTARSFFFSAQRTWRRKLEETLMALELERRFTKQQIFELYANQVYLGSRGSFAIHGFGEAAQAYFDKDVRELSLGEAAILDRAFHSAERVFVFGDPSFADPGNYTPTPAELALSGQIMGYWTRFAKTGDPNGSGATQWPRYDAHTDAMIQLDDTSTQINGYRSPQCDFYDLNGAAFSSLQ